MAATLVLSFFFSAGCGLAPIHNWPAVEGRVIDKLTGDPVAGAHVIALWQGVAAHSSSVCFHVESAISDENGNYLIPSWRNDYRFETSGSQEIVLYAHKTGYMGVDQYGNTPFTKTEALYDVTKVYKQPSVPGVTKVKSGAVEKRDILLTKFQGDADKNLRYLVWLRVMVSCGHADEENSKQVKFMLWVMYQEAKEIVNADVYNEHLERLQFSYESEEYGRESARERHNMRLKGYGIMK